MGVTRWLVRVDPATWSRACALVEARGAELLNQQTAAAALSQFGRDASEKNLRFLEGAEETPELESSFLSSLLEELVTEEEWYLDKSFNQLESVARALPGGEVLLDVIDFKGIDIEPPPSCGNIDSGLFGCCSAARLKSCADFLQAHAPEAAEAALRAQPTGFLAKFSGRTLRNESALKILSDDYHRSYWSTFRSALLETVEKGHHLGLGMSP
jgi:hypothetical protein